VAGNPMSWQVYDSTGNSIEIVDTDLAFSPVAGILSFILVLILVIY
jgi:hypothetical protein